MFFWLKIYLVMMTFFIFVVITDVVKSDELTDIAVKNKDEYILNHSTFTIRYDTEEKIPVLISWNLSKCFLGDIKRIGGFIQDKLLPKNFVRVLSSDYTNSGYDRGHICPSGDRTRIKEENKETFVMTNIVPQISVTNRKVWYYFEQWLRSLVKTTDKELYIISGVFQTKGKISKKEIGVPENLFKCVLIIDDGDEDLKRINARETDTQSLCIMVTNDKTNINNITNDWKDYIIDLDTIETLINYDLFNKIHKDIIIKEY